jgi:hypothetical protein
MKTVFKTKDNVIPLLNKAPLCDGVGISGNVSQHARKLSDLLARSVTESVFVNV